MEVFLFLSLFEQGFFVLSQLFPLWCNNVDLAPLYKALFVEDITILEVGI